MKDINKRIQVLLTSTRLIFQRNISPAHAFSEDSHSIYENHGQINLQDLKIRLNKDKELDLSNQQQAFKLYTASSINSGDYIGTGCLTQDETSQNGMYDYVSLTMPSQYTLDKPQLTSSSYRPYTENLTNNTGLSGYGLKNSDITNKKIISHYIHNWDSAKLNISLSASGGVPGAGLSISNANKYWKISSYVII